MAFSRSVRDYLARRSAAGPWRLDAGGQSFPGGIIVPAFAEAETLPLLLESLCADPTLPASGLAVVVVVNNRTDATSSEKANNRRSIELLRQVGREVAYPLFVVDAASPGLELPEKDGGVGLARKIGHDLLLPVLDPSRSDPILVSLDADTLVEAGYAGALIRHFAAATAGGAVIPFAHSASADEGENRAIVRYELFLRCYVAGLSFAGSPYAFHTVGSAMACTASAYVRSGGMNRRRAGEDFYFLQGLAKTAGVLPVAGTRVHPSPRRSHRVPFGTGRAVGALLDGEQGAVLFHQPRAFHVLKEWLVLVREACLTGASELFDSAAEVCPDLPSFLEGQAFRPAWEKLRAQHRTPARLSDAFHGWFDAFRTMKLLHFLADGSLPRKEPEEVVRAFPEVWGCEELTLTERLEFLRAKQGA